MLNKLRKKSEHTRMVVAGIVAVLVTLVVVFFWAWSNSGRFSDSKEIIKDDVKPFGILKESISDVFGDYKNQRAEIKQEQKDKESIVEQYIEEQSLIESAAYNEFSDAYGFDIEERNDAVEATEANDNELDEFEMLQGDENSSTE